MFLMQEDNKMGYASRDKKPLSEIAVIDAPVIEKIKQDIGIPNTITDLSDYKRIIISETQPTNPVIGDLWIDTSET
jgi:hypothetical protein